MRGGPEVTSGPEMRRQGPGLPTRAGEGGMLGAEPKKSAGGADPAGVDPVKAVPPGPKKQSKGPEKQSKSER